MQFLSGFLSHMTTPDSPALLRNTMNPNRKARRERERRAIKKHTKEPEETRRGIYKKAPRKPPVPLYSNVSRFNVQCDGFVGAIETGVDWLCVVGFTLLKYIMVAFTVLIASFSGPEVKTVPRKSKSAAITNDTATSYEEDVASHIPGHDKECTSEEVDITQPMIKKALCDKILETVGSAWPETESPSTTYSIPSTADDSDNATTVPSTSFTSSPRSSVSIDTPSGKSTDPPWYLQKFDEIDVQRLRKCLSNDTLERHVWARDDKDALNHVPRNVYFSEEISCWWSDEVNDGQGEAH